MFIIISKIVASLTSFSSFWWREWRTFFSWTNRRLNDSKKVVIFLDFFVLSCPVLSLPYPFPSFPLSLFLSFPFPSSYPFPFLSFPLSLFLYPFPSLSLFPSLPLNSLSLPFLSPRPIPFPISFPLPHPHHNSIQSSRVKVYLSWCFWRRGHLVCRVNTFPDKPWWRSQAIRFLWLHHGLFHTGSKLKVQVHNRSIAAKMIQILVRRMLKC